jgi:uncharacterized protein
MKRSILLVLSVVFLLSLPVGWLAAENPNTLPIPTSYVNDYAHVLTPQGAARIEQLCREVQQQADAQLFVVTIKTLDNGMTKEEFTDQLEEHWKAGKKGVDREALFLYVAIPRGTRIETGYGLEGILNDAKVGAILDQADPLIKQGDYDDGLYTGVEDLASVIAQDKGVTLTTPVHQYHDAQQPAAAHGLGVGQIVLGVLFLVVFVILVLTGHVGWAFWLLLNMLGGGGGGGGGRGGGDDGPGFGGIGGGSSGGGGASRDF